jgi:hypothetical protein
MTPHLFPAKGTLESVVLTFDFTPKTGPAPTVSNIRMEIVVAAGLNVDPNPAAVLASAAQVNTANGAQVLQRVQGGLDSNDYRIQCTVDTSDGDTLTIPAILPVRRYP